MSRVRKHQFWLDNEAGTLTEFTSDVNNTALARMVEILDQTHINADDETVVSGLRSGNIPLNGYYNDTGSGIIDTLVAAQGTSVTKTWQLKYGDDYYYGECLPEGLEISGDGKALVTWSCTLRIDAGATKTSAAQ